MVSSLRPTGDHLQKAGWYFKRAAETASQGLSVAQAETPLAQSLRQQKNLAEGLSAMTTYWQQLGALLQLQPVTFDHCLEASKLHWAEERLAGSEYLARFVVQRTTLVHETQQTLRQTLQAQAAQATSVDKLRLALGILILSGVTGETPRPDDLNRLGSLMNQAWQDLNRYSNQLTHDYTASAVPMPVEIPTEANLPLVLLEAQIQQVKSFEKEIQLVGEAVALGHQLHAHYQNQVQALTSIQTQLHNWLERLGVVQSEVIRIDQMLYRGLRDGHFERAEMALGLADEATAQKIDPNSKPIGTGLRGFAHHPTVIWLRDEKLPRFRELYAQEACRHQQFEWFLPFLAVTTPHISARLETWQRQFAQRTPTPCQEKFHQRIETLLQHGKTPVEGLLDLLRDMYTQEPEDRTRLQASLTYVLDDGTTLQGRPKIAQHFELLVKQLNEATHWLSRFHWAEDDFKSLPDQMVVVNWPAQRQLMLRKVAEANFKAAEALGLQTLGQRQCTTRACSNFGAPLAQASSACPLCNQEGHWLLVDKQWPLIPVLAELTTPPSALVTPLSVPVREGDAQRRNYVERIQQTEAEVHSFIALVLELKKDYLPKWEALMASLDVVETTPFLIKLLPEAQQRFNTLVETLAEFLLYWPLTARFQELYGQHPDLKKALPEALRKIIARLSNLKETNRPYKELVLGIWDVFGADIRQKLKGVL